jgi:hypothetical protein
VADDTVSEASHLINLQTRHNGLKQRIAEEYRRPLPDTELLSRLKIEKLYVKEQIERVKSI